MSTFLDSVIQTAGDIQKQIADSMSPQQLLFALLTFAVLLISSLLLLWRRKRRSSRRCWVALTGTCDAGKTVLFAELVGARDVATYTSQKQNVHSQVSFTKSGLAGGGGRWQLVDVPGAENIRRQILREYLGQLRAMLFVVDSSSFMRESRDVAEYLYDLLAEPQLAQVPFLVVCNKQDLPVSKSAQVIRSQLEKEFELLQRSRAAQLSSTAGSEGVKPMLTARDKRFGHSLLPQRVQFAECVARVRPAGDDAGLGASQVFQWLFQYAPP